MSTTIFPTKTGVQVFSSPSVLYRYMNANMKVFKAHDMSLKVRFVWVFFFAASSCRRFRRFLDHLCKDKNAYPQTTSLDAMKLSYIKEDAVHSRIDLKRKKLCTRSLCLHSLMEVRGSIGRIQESYVNSWYEELLNKVNLLSFQRVQNLIFWNLFVLAWQLLASGIKQKLLSMVHNNQVCFCWKTISNHMDFTRLECQLTYKKTFSPAWL